MPDLTPYLNILPTGLIVLGISFFLTPLVGAAAKKYGFIDLPKSKRKRTDKSLSTRIHTEAKLRLGGLAVMIPFLIVLISQLDGNPTLHGIFWGLLVLIIGGVIDDKFELSAKKQMLIQLFAAILVVLSGLTIRSISFAGTTLDFSTWTHSFNLGLFTYNCVFPGDLITIGWILGIINAINWMSGIDAIGELTVFIAAFTGMLMGVRSGQYELALLSAALAAGLLGFVPFNLPPSKIMSGTAGTTSYGFILAALAVINGSKITSAVMLLSLPILDMVWVMVYRLINLKEIPFLKRPFVGGNVHCHHRLMALGLSQSQVLWLEISIVSVISILAFSVSGFSDNFIALMVVIAALIIIFTTISIIQHRKKKSLSMKKNEPPQPPMVTSEPTPEQKYAY